MTPETVYIVAHRTEPNTSGSIEDKDGGETTSYLTDAFTSKNQAYRAAIREQIRWLKKCQPVLAEAATQINERKGLSLDCRLDRIQDKFDEIEESQPTIQRWDVKEFRLSGDSDHSSDEEGAEDEGGDENEEDGLDEDDEVEGEEGDEQEDEDEDEGEEEEEDEEEEEEEEEDGDEEPAGPEEAAEDEDEDDDDEGEGEDQDETDEDEDGDDDNDDAPASKRPRN
ncbi:unnamed protein product [Calypogeia fissa]